MPPRLPCAPRFYLPATVGGYVGCLPYILQFLTGCGLHIPIRGFPFGGFYALDSTLILPVPVRFLHTFLPWPCYTYLYRRHGMTGCTLLRSLPSVPATVYTLPIRSVGSIPLPVIPGSGWLGSTAFGFTYRCPRSFITRCVAWLDTGFTGRFTYITTVIPLPVAILWICSADGVTAITDHIAVLPTRFLPCPHTTPHVHHAHLHHVLYRYRVHSSLPHITAYPAVRAVGYVLPQFLPDADCIHTFTCCHVGFTHAHALPRVPFVTRLPHVRCVCVTFWCGYVTLPFCAFTLRSVTTLRSYHTFTFIVGYTTHRLPSVLPRYRSPAALPLHGSHCLVVTAGFGSAVVPPRHTAAYHTDCAAVTTARLPFTGFLPTYVRSRRVGYGLRLF